MEHLKLKDFLASAEKRYIERIIKEFSQESFEVKAQVLGISVSSLYNKCKEYGITTGLRTRNPEGKQLFFEKLDNAKLNTNIVIKEKYSVSTIKNYTGEWCSNQREKIRYVVSEIASGYCVYLYKA